MINFKKGPALSLQQVNYVGKPEARQDAAQIVAGMVVRVKTNAEIAIGSTGTLANDTKTLFGFAINNQSSGDVIEAGVIGVYALDGASVIETDQLDQDLTASNFPIGQPLSMNAAGKVTARDSANANEKIAPSTFTGKIIGYVEGIRDLPGKQNETVTLSTGRSFTTQRPVKVLGVKLAS
jgi:hypothetical protein